MCCQKNKDDIVIVSALRTPIAKAGRGAFRGLTNDVLVYHAIKGILDKTRIDPSLIDEVCFGHGLSPMNGSTALRIGALRAGLSLVTPVSTFNRQCGSGLDSVSIIANKIRVGEIEIGLAGGFESMSFYPINQGKITCYEDDVDKVKECFISMGETAEILAEKYSITREESDIFAMNSHKRAAYATINKLYTNEIIPVKIDNSVITEDEGIRVTNLEKLASLKSVFRKGGICTAGNSSQLSDGASAVLLMKRHKAEELEKDILGSLIDYVCVGTNPSIMGQGPVPAIRKLLHRNNLAINDIDYFEINEAFACQALFCIKELEIDQKRVNLHGGAIALGHPIGCTGSRLVASLLNVMGLNNMQGFGVVSLCVGTGQGVAALIRRE